jgi:hypothetical protein
MTLLKPIAAMLALAAFGVCVGLGADALMRPAPPRTNEMAAATIGGLDLVVPSQFLRQGARHEAAERLDAVLRHPIMTPAAWERPAAGLPPATARHLVFLSVTRADGGIDPSERPQDLYGRFLEPDTWQNPGGLLLRRFQAGSPYDDEEIYLAPPDGRAFTARCRKPTRSAERLVDIGEACLWRYRRDGADIQVRFSPELLPDWEALSAGVRQRVDEWAARPAKN